MHAFLWGRGAVALVVPCLFFCFLTTPPVFSRMGSSVGRSGWTVATHTLVEGSGLLY